MAGKSHVDVNERRLRPVYDALDNLNNKQAIKLADAILKKQKDLHCAKALKALALVRSSRLGESDDLLQEIKTTCPLLDDNTLQAMTMCYKETQRPEGVVDVYEMAVKQSPKNEEFLSHLFMGYVRIGNYVKQQQIAMNLYKAVPKNPYYFWSVMSAYMQAISTTDPKRMSMLLILSERMVDKFIKENKIEAEEEIRLYLLILEKLEKYKEALEFLKGPFGDRLGGVLNERVEKEGEYLKILQHWPEATAHYKKLVKEHPDNWLYLKSYIESFFKQTEKKENGNEENGVIEYDSDEDVYSYLSSIQAENEHMRGPRLALMELSKQILERDDTQKEEMTSKVYSGLVTYFEVFGHKQCAFIDMRLYIGILTEEQQQMLIQELREKVGDSPKEETNAEKIRHLQQTICVECLARRIGVHEKMTHEEKFNQAKVLMKKYKDSLELGVDMMATEPLHGDQLVLLAAYLLLDVNREKNDDAMTWHILLILEDAAENSINSQFKLLLLYLYSKLGAYRPCQELIEKLEVKYMMYDSIGYFLTRYAYSSGNLQATASLYDASMTFYHSAKKDTPEQIISSYKYGSFRQVPEMVEFKHRVADSYQFCFLTLEKMHLDLLRFANNVTETKLKLLEMNEVDYHGSFIDKLRDNRDFGFLNNLEPNSRDITKDDKEQSFQHIKLWLQLRYYILRSFQLGYSFLLHPKSMEKVSNGATVDGKESGPGIPSLLSGLNLVDMLISEIKTADTNERTWTNPHLPPPCEVFWYVENRYHELIINLIKACSKVQNCADLDSDCINIVVEQLRSTSELLTDLTSKIIPELTTMYDEKEIFNGLCLKHVTYLLESCHYLVLFTHILIESVKMKSGSHDKTNNKKKKGAATQPQASKPNELVVAINDFNKHVTGIMKNVSSTLKNVKTRIVDKELDQDSIDQLFRETSSETVTKILKKIQGSYQQSIEELVQLFNLKVRFMSSLHT